MPTTPLIAQQTLRVDEDPAQQRFNLFDGEQFIGFIQYALDGDVLDFQHTIIREEYSRHGYARALTTIAFERLWGRGQTVVPTCTYTEEYLRRHPQYEVLRAS